MLSKQVPSQAAPIDAHIIPTYGWAYNDALEPRNFDPELAAQMLEDAGWVLNEGAEFRVCQGCGTTEDGTEMKLNLTTNAGNETRENIIALAQQQWGEVGVEVVGGVVGMISSVPTPSAPSMTYFSSRGPNPVVGDLIKPDITAPGIQILAGNTPTPIGGVQGEYFQAIAGTSMSSPVVAGVYALIKQAHPDWSEAMAKSAIMTTAYQGVVDNDRSSPADPFDFGAGHVDPGNKVHKGSAFQPGLVYEAGLFEYAAFTCGQDWGVFTPGSCDFLEGLGVPTDPSDLNYPSIGIDGVPGTQTIKRTVTSVAPGNRTFTVSVDAPAGYDVTVEPSSFTLKTGESLTYEVTITNVSAPIGEWRHGSLTWHEKTGNYDVYSPISVNAALFSAPAEVEFRVGLASCGVANGARPVHEALEAAVREAGRGVARGVGCGGMCHREPLVEVVEADGGSAIYTHVTPEVVPALVRRHLRPKGLLTRARWMAAGLVESGNGIHNVPFSVKLLDTAHRQLNEAREQPPDEQDEDTIKRNKQMRDVGFGVGGARDAHGGPQVERPGGAALDGLGGAQPVEAALVDDPAIGHAAVILRSTAADTSASVHTKHSMVAMSGRIIPAPLATATMV